MTVNDNFVIEKNQKFLLALSSGAFYILVYVILGNQESTLQSFLASAALTHSSLACQLTS